MNREIEIRRLQKNDLETFKKLVEVLNEVFQEYNTIASIEHLQKLLKKSDFLAIVVIVEGDVIGGVTGYELQKYYNDNSELYIYDIAVKNEFQNQGMGKRLIQFIKAYGLEQGIETLFVEAYSGDEQAVKFYESVFGASEKIDHFNFEVKNLL